MSSQRQTPILVISGVSISRDTTNQHVDIPYPDYLVLREVLLPDIMDVETIAAVTSPLLRIVRRRFGQQWAIAFSAMLRSRRYHVVLATGEDVGLPYALLSRLVPRRTLLIVTCHNIATRRPAFFLGRLKVGQAITRFLCLSNAQAEILSGRYGIPQQHIQVIYWIVDHTFFHPDPSVPVRRQICSAGMASRDYATLVEATRDLDVEVKIAADSPWFRQSLNISSTALPPHIEVRSYGTYRALRHLYAESRFVVVPLLDVDFSAGYTVILEAMAMGKAVIVSETRQKDDFVIDGWNGFRVPPGDVGQLRERIRFLLDRPDETARMGAKGRTMVEEHFTLAQYAQELNQAVDHVLRATEN